MSNKNDSGMFYRGLFIGALLGGAAGAITALLYAPKTGVELRKELSDKSSEYYDKASNYVNNVEGKVGNTVNNAVNEGKNKAQIIVEIAKKQAGDLMENADTIIQGAKAKAIAAKDIVEEKISDFRDAAKAGAEAFRNELKS